MDIEAPKERIIQEFVPGKQVTLAHVIANPDPRLYAKLGLSVTSGALGVLTITPSEAATSDSARSSGCSILITP